MKRADAAAFDWIGRHRHGSTYLLLGSLIGFAVLTHPSLTGFLLLVMNGAALFIAREVARMEGTVGGVSKMTILGSCGVIVVVVLLLVSVRFVAI